MTLAVLAYPKKSFYNFFSGMDWKLICFVCFFACLSLLVYYVFQVVHLTSGSYSIESYEVKVSQLLEEKRDLEVSFAENSFLASLQKKISGLNFQKTTSVKYIQLPDSYLARAK